MNRNLYCRNDPINLYDPNGENPVSDFWRERAVEAARIAVRTAKDVNTIREIRDESILIGKKKNWPYAHVYASAKIKQDVGLLQSIAAGFGKEVLDLKNGLEGNKDSLRSAGQLQDAHMNFIGYLIPEGTTPTEWATIQVSLQELDEGAPGPFYWIAFTPFFQVTADLASQENSSETAEAPDEN